MQKKLLTVALAAAFALGAARWLQGLSVGLAMGACTAWLSAMTSPARAARLVGLSSTLGFGGGALLTGLPERLANETGMPIRIAADPLYAVALGSGQALEELDALKGVLLSTHME